MTYERESDYKSGGEDTLGTIMPKFLWGHNRPSPTKISPSLSKSIRSRRPDGLRTDQYGSETGSLRIPFMAETQPTAPRFTDAAVPNVTMGSFRTESLLTDDSRRDQCGGMTYAQAVKNGVVTPVPAYAIMRTCTNGPAVSGRSRSSTTPGLRFAR